MRSERDNDVTKSASVESWKKLRVWAWCRFRRDSNTAGHSESTMTHYVSKVQISGSSSQYGVVADMVFASISGIYSDSEPHLWMTMP